MSPFEFGEVEAATAAFDDSPLFMIVTEGADHVVTAANRGLRQGVGHRQLLGRACREVWPELGPKAWWHRLDHVYRTGQHDAIGGWRAPIEDSDGSVSEVRVNVVLTAWRRADGSIRGVLAAGHRVREESAIRPTPGDWANEPRTHPGRGVVTTLQDALLPADLPILPTLSLSVQYLLDDDDTNAGGDWFDVIVLPDGRIALVVGDVVGQGIEAAALMGRLRAILQERLESGAGVAGSLGSLSRFAERIPEAAGTTLCIAVIDPHTGRLEYVTAGHPPPLVVDAHGGFRYLEPSCTSPLAMGRSWPTSHDRLARDELLVLYSDGIIDRPTRSSAESTIELAHAARDVLVSRRLPTAQRSDHDTSGEILESMVGGTGFQDDVTVLTAELASAPDDFDRSVRPVRESIRRVSSELEVWLDGLRAGGLDKQAILHAFAEVVSNAVDNACAQDATEAAVVVHGSLTPSGKVRLTVRDRGHWSNGEAHANGRGLALAGGLVDRLRVRHVNGTTVTIDHRLSRPARIMRGPGRVRRQVPEDVSRPGFIEVALGKVRITGPLDWLTADELRAGLLRATRAGSHPAVVDLTEVTQLASPAVQVLFEAIARNLRHDTALSLIAPPGTPAQHILEVVGLPYTGGGGLLGA